jgi:hypothetical protein
MNVAAHFCTPSRACLTLPTRTTTVNIVYIALAHGLWMHRLCPDNQGHLQSSLLAPWLRTGELVSASALRGAPMRHHHCRGGRHLCRTAPDTSCYRRESRHTVRVLHPWHGAAPNPPTLSPCDRAFRLSLSLPVVTRSALDTSPLFAFPFVPLSRPSVVWGSQTGSGQQCT